jgi:CRP-like cAMP-binding protein
MTQLITLLERELKKHNSETSYTQLKKGDYFLYTGQVNKHIAVVKSGYLRSYHHNEKGDEITTDFHQPGNVCASWCSFYSEQPSFEYIQAITDCELHLVDYQVLQKIYRESFEINVLGRKLLEQALFERDLRTKKILYLTSKEKHQWFIENYTEIYKVAKPSYIASFLFISTETLNRVRRTLIS